MQAVRNKNCAFLKIILNNIIVIVSWLSVIGSLTKQGKKRNKKPYPTIHHYYDQYQFWTWVRYQFCYCVIYYLNRFSDIFKILLVIPFQFWCLFSNRSLERNVNDAWIKLCHVNSSDVQHCKAVGDDNTSILGEAPVQEVPPRDGVAPHQHSAGLFPSHHLQQCWKTARQWP